MLDDTNQITPAQSNSVRHTAAPVAVEPAGITLYANKIPAFVAEELPRLYGNIYSSLAQWQTWGALESDFHVYVVRRGQRIETLLVYRIEGTTARVLNEGIRLDGATTEQFAEYVFGACPHVAAISFHAVRSRFEMLRFPYQRFNCLEDIVLDMPATAEQYLASLGGATRSYIKRYLNKCKRDFPGFAHEVHVDGEIDEQTVRDVIELNRWRMREKGKHFGTDHAEIARIVRLARQCGLVSVIRIGGRVCAGTVNYEAGGNYFLEVIAHDPAYNDYRLGTLCCYLTICECIRRGGREYHFLWGQHDYKFRLGGVQHDLDHIALYRSRMALMRHTAMVFRNWQTEYLRKAQLWIRNARKEIRIFARMATAAVESLRGNRTGL
jgi:hypothetical protein